MRLNQIAANIEPGSHGIWICNTKSPVSYPDVGNNICFQIEDNSFWFRHRSRCIMEAIRQFSPNGPVFDIGGGNGYVSLGLQDAGWSVVLVEPGPAGAANARRRGIERVICATFEDAGFFDGSLPAVGLFDVIEHVGDDSIFLRSIARSLMLGGRLYLTVPALSGLWSQEDDDAGHYRRYTLAGLRSVLEGAGLRVEYLTCFFRPLVVPILLLRTIPYKLGIRYSAKDFLARASAAHDPPTILRTLSEKLLTHEAILIRSCRTMSLGSSCLAVATKI